MTESLRRDLYVFRHGETDLNVEKRWQGSGMNYDLNETGIAQAKILAEKLKGKGIEIVFSSPMKRALHTAEIAGEAIGAPVLVRDNLRECYYGDNEGRLFSETMDYVTAWKSGQDFCMPGGESLFAARTRVLKELEALCGEPYKTMGIAIHGGTMSSLLRYFDYRFSEIPNCAVFHLVKQGDDWRIEGELF